MGKEGVGNLKLTGNNKSKRSRGETEELNYFKSLCKASKVISHNKRQEVVVNNSRPPSEGMRYIKKKAGLTHIHIFILFTVNRKLH